MVPSYLVYLPTSAPTLCIPPPTAHVAPMPLPHRACPLPQPHTDLTPRLPPLHSLQHTPLPRATPVNIMLLRIKRALLAATPTHTPPAPPPSYPDPYHAAGYDNHNLYTVYFTGAGTWCGPDTMAFALWSVDV